MDQVLPTPGSPAILGQGRSGTGFFGDLATMQRPSVFRSPARKELPKASAAVFSTVSSLSSSSPDLDICLQQISQVLQQLMGGIYFHSFGASILSIAIIQCISFWGNERLPLFSAHLLVFYFSLSLFYWALNINNQPSLIQLILQILIFFMPSTIKPKRRLMKAEEMVRVIKNQFFYLVTLGVLIFSSHIFTASFLPEEF